MYSEITAKFVFHLPPQARAGFWPRAQQYTRILGKLSVDVEKTASAIQNFLCVSLCLFVAI